MNLTDLTEVLRDHAQPSDTVVNARLAGVRAKVVAARRRRAVAGAACVVLALVGAVFAVLPRAGQSSEPALNVRSFPEYQDGTRLVAQAWGDLPTSSVSVRFVPKSLDFTVFSQCDIGHNRLLLVKITVNDKWLVGGGCGGGARSMDWAALGVVVGQPSVVTLEVDGERDNDSRTPATLAPPPSGSIALGVGEGVPMSEYPLPPRPAALEPLPESFADPAVTVSSDPGDPVARKEITVAWPGTRMVKARLNTPGRLLVLVNDVPAVDYTHWKYDVAEAYSARLDEFAPGDPVRITVIPEGVTGDWEVVLTTS